MLTLAKGSRRTAVERGGVYKRAGVIDLVRSGI